MTVSLGSFKSWPELTVVDEACPTYRTPCTVCQIPSAPRHARRTTRMTMDRRQWQYTVPAVSKRYTDPTLDRNFAILFRLEELMLQPTDRFWSRTVPTLELDDMTPIYSIGTSIQPSVPSDLMGVTGHDIGATGNYWRDIYVRNLHADTITGMPEIAHEHSQYTLEVHFQEHRNSDDDHLPLNPMFAGLHNLGVLWLHPYAPDVHDSDHHSDNYTPLIHSTDEQNVDHDNRYAPKTWNDTESPGYAERHDFIRIRSSSSLNGIPAGI